MRCVDYYFHYKNVVRFLLLNKFSINELTTCYNVAKIELLNIFFSIKDIEYNINDLSLCSYFYLFRFFFGRKGFISKLNYGFVLNFVYNSFNIQFFLSKKDIYFSIYFLSNDVLPFIGKKNWLYYDSYIKILNLS